MLSLGIVVAFLGFQAAPAVDWTVDSGINVVLYRRGLPDDVDAAVSKAMHEEAVVDSRFADDLRFQSKQAMITTFTRHYDDSLFKWIREGVPEDMQQVSGLETLFFNDGGLPSVRYGAISIQSRDFLTQAENSYDTYHAFDVFQEYVRHREHGDTPDQAMEELKKKKDALQTGIAAIGEVLESVGGHFLTGYDSLAADGDFPLVLEGFYAAHHPKAKDIVGVTKCMDPFDYLEKKVALQMFFDSGTMMGRINDFIEHTIEQRRNEPLPPSQIPASSPLPKADDLGEAGVPPGVDDWGEVVTDIDGKQCERAVNDPYDPIKSRRSFVFDAQNPEAMAWVTVRWRAHSNGLNAGLNPNTEYDVTFAPWYRADVDNACFLCPIRVIDSDPYRSDVGEDGRVYLRANGGSAMVITVRMRTDYRGFIKFAIVPVAACAISVGRIWVQDVAR